MALIRFTGDDTVLYTSSTATNMLISNDFGKGDYLQIEFDGKIGDIIAGKNGNIMGYRIASGILCNCTLKIVRSGPVDIQINSDAISQLKNGPSFLSFQVARMFLDENQNVITERQTLVAIIDSLTGSVFSSDGNEEQPQSTWKFRCAVQNNTPRTLS